jgi:xanthine dehydrogenase YagS FAD-binding subunit
VNRFAWTNAKSISEAAAVASTTVADAMTFSPEAMERGDTAIVKANGIDVLDLLKEGLLKPANVVSLTGVPGLDEVVEDKDGGLRIGPMATLASLSEHRVLQQRYPALAEALRGSASPQIRNVATLGGNLLQRPRCWYFRSAAHHCARKGGDHCFAFAGENHYHAVFGHAGCAIVHPSTVATALVALDAHVELATAQGTSRTVKLGDFLVGPEIDTRRETDLRAGEVLTAVLLPPASPGARSAFLKQAEKPSFDWSIADVAVVLECAPDGRCRRAAVVLGAAAPVPWRARQAESVLAGQMIDPVAARAAGQAAIAGAAPLPHNAYKLPILAALVRRAVLQAAGTADPEDAR